MNARASQADRTPLRVYIESVPHAGAGIVARSRDLSFRRELLDCSAVASTVVDGDEPGVLLVQNHLSVHAGRLVPTRGWREVRVLCIPGHDHGSLTAVMQAFFMPNAAGVQ